MTIVLLSVNIKHGNLFNSQCQTLVNTVNCQGFMGAGIALEFKFRHPNMFRRYVDLCNNRQLDIGKLWLYKPNPPHDVIDHRWVLNFPTKRHWRLPSKRKYLEEGLANFVRTYRERGIRSVAFPLLGAANGRFDEDESEEIMQRYLTQCDIPVEIYRFDPDADDDLYEQVREWLLETAPETSAQIPRTVIDAIREHDDIKLISHLTCVKGIGSRSIEKLMQLYSEHIQQGDPEDACEALKQASFVLMR